MLSRYFSRRDFRRDGSHNLRPNDQDLWECGRAGKLGYQQRSRALRFQIYEHQPTMVRDAQLGTGGSHPVQVYQRGQRGDRELGGGSKSYLHCARELRYCGNCEQCLAVVLNFCTSSVYKKLTQWASLAFGREALC